MHLCEPCKILQVGRVIERPPQEVKAVPPELFYHLQKVHIVKY